MKYLGLSVTIFMFLSFVILITIYLVSGFKKKYHFANGILLYLFLHALFTIAVLSWSLILMNEGFNVLYSISVNYEIVLIFVLPVSFGMFLVDYTIRKNLTKYKNKTSQFLRFLLPVILVVLFIITSTIFYFNINYFNFLINW